MAYDAVTQKTVLFGGSDTGGNLADTFDFTADITGAVLGGAGVDTFDVDVAIAGSVDGGTGIDILDLSTLAAARSVVLTAGVADGYAGTEAAVGGGFADIGDIRGSTA